MRLGAFWMVISALFAAGCGGYWLERVPVTVRGGATLEVRARVEGGAVGSVTVVEQRPGQGFVLEQRETRAESGGVYLAGFEAPPSGAVSTEASAEPVMVVGEPTVVRTSTSSASLTTTTSTTATTPTPTTSSTTANASTSTTSTSSATASTSTTSTSTATTATTSPASTSSVAGVELSSTTHVEARAEVVRDGVWSLDGRRTSLTAITGPGVQVDGVRVHLSDLEALAELGLAPAPSTRLATDGALEAFAELEHDTLPRAGGETHVVVRVRAPASASVPRARIRVHLVIDRSSSMQRTWDRVLAAARVLVERLAADDELHIVAYGTDAIEALPIGRVGDGRAARAALDRISVGGGTNIEAGLELAYGARADRSVRSLVILLSDGVPNHGAFDPADLGTRVARARQSGTTTSVIGLGTEFDERLLRVIARQGRGGYHVSANLDALADGLVRELEAHARAAARQLAVRVSLPEGVELVGMPEGEAERSGREVVLATPSLDAGEERSIVLRVRVAPGARAREVARVSLAYRSGLDGRAVEAGRSLEVSFGPRAVASAEGAAGPALIDGALSVALDVAGQAILAGDAPGATRALDEHARFMEGRVEHGRSDALQARARVVRRLSHTVGALLPSASHAQRRQVGQAFGALSVRFAR